jgi:hypothetical protein
MEDTGMSMTRRSFLISLAAAAGATEIHPQTGMPMRTLGSTGQKVSLLAFGAGSRWLACKERDQGHKALERALKAGVNYVDSAASYGDGQSEQWIGEFLKTHDLMKTSTVTLIGFTPPPGCLCLPFRGCWREPGAAASGL